MGKTNRDRAKATKKSSSNAAAASSSGTTTKSSGGGSRTAAKQKKPSGGLFFGDVLERELAAVGLRVAKITADGNCLFRSVGDQLEVG